LGSPLGFSSASLDVRVRVVSSPPLGSALAWLIGRRRADWTHADGPALAAGAIAGEAVTGIMIAILFAAGVLSR